MKRVMLPVEEVDIAATKYQPESIKAPHVTGWALRVFVWMMEAPLLGPIIFVFLKHQNHITRILKNTVIPETPMFKPEFPPQDGVSSILHYLPLPSRKKLSKLLITFGNIIEESSIRKI